MPSWVYRRRAHGPTLEYRQLPHGSSTRSLTTWAASLYQDRCTKNYYMYLNPATGEWLMFPWDNEDAFAFDRRVGVQLCHPDLCAANASTCASP
jgi:hypothetical protein